MTLYVDDTMYIIGTLYVIARSRRFACDVAIRSPRAGLNSYLDRKLSVTIMQAFEVCNASDCDDFYIVAKEDVDLQIDNALKFMRTICDYLIAQGVAVSLGDVEGAEA